MSETLKDELERLSKSNLLERVIGKVLAKETDVNDPYNSLDWMDKIRSNWQESDSTENEFSDYSSRLTSEEDRVNFLTAINNEIEIRKWVSLDCGETCLAEIDIKSFEIEVPENLRELESKDFGKPDKNGRIVIDHGYFFRIDVKPESLVIWLDNYKN